MDGESRRQQLRLTVRAWRRARYAAWATAVGIALSFVTVIVSALNAISTQQAIAMAVPAVLITVGGLVGQIVPEALIAWRRGFRFGCEAAQISQARLTRPDDALNKLGRKPAGRKRRLIRRRTIARFAGEGRSG